MRVLCPTLAVVLLLTGCSVPELEEREMKIVVAETPSETNDAVRVRTQGVAPKDSLFREYDAKMIGRIEKRWLELTPLIQLRGVGQVVADFTLKPDGQVTDVRIRPTRLLGFTVEICRQAILDSAPFDPWPAEMRRLIGETGREVTFRFNYSTNKPPSESRSPHGTQIQTNGVKVDSGRKE
jgi:hypothetical protein